MTIQGLHNMMPLAINVSESRRSSQRCTHLTKQRPIRRLCHIDLLLMVMLSLRKMLKERRYCYLALESAFYPISYLYCNSLVERSGKTSIQQVIFNNLPPKQTFYLESTMRIVRHNVEYVCHMIYTPRKRSLVHQYSHSARNLGHAR